MKYDYDLVIVGGGAAGIAAAIMAANIGATTALIESRRLGGECTFTGCIPSKTLIHVARLFHDARKVRSFTATASGDQSVDFAAVMQHVRSVRERIYQSDDAPPNLEKRGVDVIAGHACFTGPHELQVRSHDGTLRPVRFRYAIIATGSEPLTLQTTLPCLTNETLFEIRSLPRRFVIAGAGPVGIETAQAFARLGSAVTVVTPQPRVLPKDDDECAQIVQNGLEAEGVRFLFGRGIAEYRPEDGRRVAVLDDGTRLEADVLLAAIGRRPRVRGLGLDAAGVKTKDAKIVFDRRTRTTAKHIFLSGDVAQWHEFTHAAEHMSRVAVTNALFRIPAKLEAARMTWATFTSPEIAHAGETQERLDERGARYSVLRMPYSRIDRAVTDDATPGLIKVFADRRGRVLGTTIVGERAGDLVGEWTLGISKGLSLRELSGTIHAYPTYALGSKRLADEWYASRIASVVAPIARRIFKYGR